MSVRVAEGMPLPVEVAGTRCEWCHIVGAPRDPSDRTSLLWRTADATEKDPIIAWIGMNPSCADEHHSDKTCHVCWHTSRREGFKRYMMLNLFSAPATDPPDLLVYSGRPGNHREVAHLAREAHKGGGRVVAAEILIANPAVRNIIREGKSHQLDAIIQTGAEQGMQTMDRTLVSLVQAGTVTYDNAREFAVDLTEFERLMRG